jgi:hypothetical protein
MTQVQLSGSSYFAMRYHNSQVINHDPLPVEKLSFPFNAPWNTLLLVQKRWHDYLRISDIEYAAAMDERCSA